MSSIQPFVWRHFCVDNPSITISVDKVKGGYITIARNNRLQGRSPVIDTELLFKGLQGAFLCRHITLSSPTQGTLQYMGTGWFYKPNPGATIIPAPPGGDKPPDDSFTFKLSYFGQDSPVAVVNIMFV